MPTLTVEKTSWAPTWNGQRGGLVDAAPPRSRRPPAPLTSSTRIGELVAAQAGQRVALAQAGLQPPRGLHEQVVAGRVAQPVVDRLEVVEVEEEDREGVALAPPGPGEGALHQVQEHGAVGQPGERIVEGVVNHPVGGRAPLGDVHHRPAQPDGLAGGVADRPGPRQHPAPVPALMTEAVLALEARRASLEVGAHRPLDRVAVGGVDAVQPVAGCAGRLVQAHQLEPGVGEPEPIGAQVPVEEAVAGPLPGHRVAVVGGEGLPHQDGGPQRLPVPVRQGHHRPLVQPGLSRAARGDAQGLVDLAAIDEPLQLTAHHGAVTLREEELGQLPPHRLGPAVPELALGRAVPGQHLQPAIADEGGEGGPLEELAAQADQRRDRGPRRGGLGLGGPARQVGEQVEGALQHGLVLVGLPVVRVHLAPEPAQRRPGRLVGVEVGREKAAEARVHVRPVGWAGDWAPAWR